MLQHPWGMTREEYEQAYPIMYKGMGRALGEQGGVPLPNDQGVIFATPDLDIAETYQGSIDAGVLAFRQRPGARIADLTDRATVERIVDELAHEPLWDGEDLTDPSTAATLVDEILSASGDNAEDLAIMDDPGFIATVESMGYDGAIGWSDATGDHKAVAYINPDVLVPDVPHRDAVEDAIRAGQPVPDVVLREYPDLARW